LAERSEGYFEGQEYADTARGYPGYGAYFSGFGNEPNPNHEILATAACGKRMFAYLTSEGNKL